MRTNLKHKYVENILVKEPHIQSRASYVEMVKEYKLLDKTLSWEENTGFRRKTLETFLAVHGSLYCEYCGRQGLHIQQPTVRYRGEAYNGIATLDHVIPLSRGGAPYDPANIKIACAKCNNIKGAMSEVEFLKLIQKKS